MLVLFAVGCTDASDDDYDRDDRDELTESDADGNDETIDGETDGETDKTPDPEAPPKTVLCCTGMTMSYGPEKLTYSITYGDEGVWVKADAPAQDMDSLYDHEGKVIKEIRYDENGEPDWICEYKYDANGNEIEAKDTKADGSYWTCLSRTYNEDGKPLTVKHENSSGYITYIYNYYYDDNGNFLKREDIDNEGVIDEIREYECDADGRILTYTCYQMPDKDRIGYYTYTYDADGNITEKIYTDTDGDKSRTRSSEIAVFDSVGRIIENKLYSEFSTTYHYMFTYDDDGYLVHLEDVTEGLVIEYEYEELTLPAAYADASAAWCLTVLTEGYKIEKY